ncbi:MAG: ABC transporter permease [Pirellulales bacterium]|nr:ABC transporter permease [Pirellulales bacterium]
MESLPTEPGEAQPRAAARWWRWSPRDIAPLASLAVLMVFFLLATDNFLSQATLVQVLRQGAVLGIVAVGLTYVLLCGEIDLSVGMVALWAASFCGWLFARWITGPGHAETASGVARVLLLPLVSCLAFGLATGLLTVWARLPSFIISLAMMNVAAGMSRWLTESETFRVPTVLGQLGNEGIPLSDVRELPYSALLAVGVFVVGHVVLQHTRFGRYVYMTGGNREAARLAGVQTSTIVVACLAISSVTAGLGGLLNAGRLGSVSQDQNADLLLDAVACVVLGGTSLFGGEGSMLKTAIGVITFSVLEVGLNQVQWIEDLARPMLLGTVLLVALVVNGLLAKRE